jgi:hypothetical protein
MRQNRLGLEDQSVGELSRHREGGVVFGSEASSCGTDILITACTEFTKAVE